MGIGNGVDPLVLGALVAAGPLGHANEEALVGRKAIDRLRVPIMQPDPSGRGWWHTIATAVMRRPVAVLIPVVAFILLAGSPFLHLRLATGDVTVLPKHEESRAAYDKLRSDFVGADQNHISVVVNYPDGYPLAPDRITALIELAKRIASIPNVETVNSAVSFDQGLLPSDYVRLYSEPRTALPPEVQALLTQTMGQHIVLLDAVTNVPAYSDDARNIVRAIRALDPPPGAEKVVDGFTAIDLDTVEYILGKTPVAIAYIMVATMVVLFLLLGSVVLPLKAVVMNLLSISASFGAMVWIFQDGHLSAQLGFTPGPIDPTLPVIMFCTVFGLSMDYEVLLLSRMQEEYLKERDNTHAVAMGLERSGRLITGAAAIMVGVFAAFALADMVLIKAIGLGMAIAVAIDATLVRALVVPATMRLLGNLNWWAPGPLRRLQRRMGLAEAAA